MSRKNSILDLTEPEEDLSPDMTARLSCRHLAHHIKNITINFKHFANADANVGGSAIDLPELPSGKLKMLIF